LALQTDGKVLVGGNFQTIDGAARWGVARLFGDPVSAQFAHRAISGTSVRLLCQPANTVSVYALEEQLPSGWSPTNISHDGILDPGTAKVKFGPFFDHLSRTLTYEACAPAAFIGLARVTGLASADGVNSAIVGDDQLALALPHPADLNPADWTLRLEEITSYGAAWRTGGIWQLPPNPIPIDYVTRAAALWRGGETYTTDLNIGGPPLWWINVVSIRQGRLSSEGQAFGSAVRHMPAGYVPGESLGVEIRVSPAPETKAYAVAEWFPPGSEVADINCDGQVDSINGQIKWGPFSDAASRTFRYSIRLPDQTSAILALRGVVSCDGSTAPIVGAAQAYPSVRITCGVASETNTWTISILGAEKSRWELQCSPNLIHWSPLCVFTNVSRTTAIPMVRSVDSIQMFYRLQIVP
jgi:hypothetical protein